MAIQECYYFNGVWFHWGSVQFLQVIFSLSDILVYLSWWILISVTHIFFVYILFKKDTKIKKTMKHSEKTEFIKEDLGGPTFKLWRESWDPTFKFWRESWVPLLNFEGVPRISRSRFSGSWSHFYTMPCNL